MGCAPNKNIFPPGFVTFSNIIIILILKNYVFIQLIYFFNSNLIKKKEFKALKTYNQVKMITKLNIRVQKTKTNS